MSVDWSAPPRPLTLPGGEVHVWRRSLEIDPAEERACRALLAPDERARADRFRFDRDRTAFTAARTGLRRLLGLYLNEDPVQIEILAGVHGKPELAGHPLRFNLSHSGGLALYAFHPERPVGIDLERHRLDLSHLELAERFFSPAEVRRLRALPEEARVAAFFDCWTRKEAFIKALGEGLSHPLDSFDVSLTPGDAAALLATRPDPAGRLRWHMQAIELGPGWSAALVTEGRPAAVRTFAGPPPLR